MSRQKTKPKSFQEWMEVNIWGLLIVLALVLSVGGLVEIVPLFYMKNTMEHARFPEIVWAKAGEAPIVTVDENGREQWNWTAGEGVRPYTPLELVGRDIYQREGCYTCHSQMVRPFRDEKERYGHYSLASESMFDHPFQWGSKRTGPDLARVGGKYSDAWHRQHLRDPRAVVPESVMPGYPWLDTAYPSGWRIQWHMRGLRSLGVPYTEADIEAAPALLEGKTEMDALVAYLQVLGTMVALDEAKTYRE
ncbi:cytochrome-c oxidase, cbb3-type subunit II [Marichromatium gracile]|uniref:Cytochrome oxidase subunit II n=1 Tax=Marichromatium purpuratum 984 TaxID=765910 RepID=W0E1C7_MARPU|nr:MULTISPECIES: cytochrome-c oxidase, cbb3-type subunit II [Marichromatium]AHF02916.1 cytochrome oxidase subunit II [Marichromatium purpuratum 984]MCF1182738.1 cytochrome-c oxidase, cbb3-type subunit II [Marichromatium gracile]